VRMKRKGCEPPLPPQSFGEPPTMLISQALKKWPWPGRGARLVGGIALPEKPRKKPAVPREDKAEVFRALWAKAQRLKLPVTDDVMASEYVFAPPRKWRFDVAFPGRLVAVEVDGGQYAFRGGRHSKDEDRWKRSEASARGWLVLTFSPQMLAADPALCLGLVVRALKWRAGGEA